MNKTSTEKVDTEFSPLLPSKANLQTKSLAEVLKCLLQTIAIFQVQTAKCTEQSLVKVHFQVIHPGTINLDNLWVTSSSLWTGAGSFAASLEHATINLS